VQVLTSYEKVTILYKKFLKEKTRIMKKIDFDYLLNNVYGYKYSGDGSGTWGYYLNFKRGKTYSIQELEYELSQLPLINECEIHLAGETWDAFDLRVIWNGNIQWSGLFQLEYHPFGLYDTDFIEYFEDRINAESKKSTKKFRESIKESHGFDEENEYMLGLSVVTNESLIEDTLEEDGLEVDWDYISKVSSDLDYAIERKFAKEIGNVAVEEFHDDNSYNCTFWVGFDDAKVNKYMKNLSYFDDYTRGNSTVFVYDVDEILDNEIDKLEKKYDSDILSILRECMAVEIEVPESVFEESKKSTRKSLKEAKNTEVKVYFDGHTTPSNEYQNYNFSPYSKKYEIIGLTESKDDVILTFERGNVKSLTYLGVTVDFDKENNAKCNKWECEIDIDEVQEFIIRFSLRLFK
jgi:hypothetical protein